MDANIYKNLELFMTFFLGVSGLVLAGSVYELNRQKFKLALLERRAKAKDKFLEIFDIYYTHSGFPRDKNSIHPKFEFEDAYQRALILSGEFASDTVIFSSELTSISNKVYDFINLVASNEELFQSRQISANVYDGCRKNQRNNAKILHQAGLEELIKHMGIEEPTSLHHYLLNRIFKIPFIISLMIGALFALSVLGILNIPIVASMIFFDS